MFSFLDSAHDWLFLALGWGFALITILMSWWSTDHGLGAVVAARKHCDKKALEATTLQQTLPALSGEYAEIYFELRKRALETITQGKSLMELYRQVVQRHSKYGDVEMVFPEIQIPQELEAPDPPALPRKILDDGRETRQ